MNYLTPEEQAEVRDMEDLFASSGWKRFIDKHKEAIEILPRRAIAASDEKELFIIKGQFAIMNQLVNYEDFYSNSIAALIQERQIEADQLLEEQQETGYAHAGI